MNITPESLRPVSLAEKTSSQTSEIPTKEYERFLAALPESLRAECRSRLAGSGLSPDHPVFQLLADFYEKTAPAQTADRDFLGEATLHADRSKQLLTDFRELPEVITAQIEPQLRGLLLAFSPLIAFDLGFPIFWISLWSSESCRVTVPEVSVDKHRYSAFGENKIRSAGKS